MDRENLSMKPDAQRAAALFQAAIQFTGNARTSFLENACQGDPALRRRLDALLAAHDQPEGALAEPAPAARGTMRMELADAPDETIGQKIGRYKILEKVGEGGCGVVYVAEQTEPVRRRVALKVIKLGMDTKAVVARFEAERQALAMMDHPNIAKVFDAGTTDTGRPYFIMELVRGIKITDYCDQNRLSTRERLELFIKICQAIQHAHQKGIIHRDVKPSNILVTLHDGVPVPKVIDFGIAKAIEGKLTDATVYTQLHQFIGTPAYMSPEQAEMSGLDVDTRSDIYSLGVLLYELLAGSTPFDGKELMSQGIDAMRRTIREKEPMRPSTRFATLEGEELTATAKRRSSDKSNLIHQLAGDLDWIVMKCLEKDRTRRYETANGIVADLNRHLNNEPVVARPPSAAYKFQKAFRRNKLAFTAGGAIAAALLAGIVASTWQSVRANRALDELRATAPAFAEQAQALVSREQFDDAIEKINYAIKLQPNDADYFAIKGDLLECQLKLAEAAAAYHAAFRLNPALSRAESSAQLCDELLAAKPNDKGALSRVSLAKLYLAMQQQQRPAAELMPVARLLGEEKSIVVAYWLARLKDLPATVDRSLKQSLSVREDGLLALDLSDTKVANLSPLAGMPLGSLNLNDCDLIRDFSVLRGFHSLTSLRLDFTDIGDLAPLSGLPLQELSLQNTRVSDLSVLRGMRLTQLDLGGTRVADLSPLAGMPLKELRADSIPATDYSPLAGAPLQKCLISNSQLTDLSFLRSSPIRELSLSSCDRARGYAVLGGFKSLEVLVLPENFRSLPDEDFAAIGALRNDPTLKNIQAKNDFTASQIGLAQTQDFFWKDWDREQTFLPALRKSGFKFFIWKRSNGNYGLEIRGQPLSDLSILRGAPISGLSMNNCPITDLTPIHDLPLDFLDLWNDPVSDISPLRGMQLDTLVLGGTRVSDLSPLEGLPLKLLYLQDCREITDVSLLLKIPTLEKVTLPTSARNTELLRQLPKLRMLAYTMTYDNRNDPTLTAKEFWKEFDTKNWLNQLRDSGFPLKRLEQLSDGTWVVDVSNTKIRDLTLLKGAPISSLNLNKTAVSDLSPLQGMPLKTLMLNYTGVSDISPLQGMRLEDLEIMDTKVADISVLHGMPMTTLQIGGTPVADLEPLRGMPLTSLWIFNTKVTSLRPLAGAPLRKFHLSGTKVTDLSAVRGMPLTFLRLHDCPELTDILPLADCKVLSDVTLPPNAKNIEFLRALPSIVRLSFTEDQSSYEPDKTAAEFWQEYDARKVASTRQP